MPLFISVLDDLQKSIVLNVIPMNLPTAILAFQPTATIALLVVADLTLAELAGAGYAKADIRINIDPDLERASALGAFDSLRHFRFPLSDAAGTGGVPGNDPCDFNDALQLALRACGFVTQGT
ncbi:hypothetical protein [Pseudomonas syringae]|uniref:hypothetical protein n=1 Tax=Pseudomonas syringae TaxID=317 RepID=UPI0013E90442|nr:hypothetical protein [Pseudomonas syringae]